jgi:hypothetical protein
VKQIAVIVEGYGDVAAAPSLLARTGDLLGQIFIGAHPIRAKEWPSLKAVGELERYLDLALSRNPDQILVMLDLDDGCVASEATAAEYRIQQWINGRSISASIVFLAREYETFFLHRIADIGGDGIAKIVNPDAIRDAKGRLGKELGKRYKETRDQVAFTKLIDLNLLFNDSRAFRKLCKELSGSSYDNMSAEIAG